MVSRSTCAAAWELPLMCPEDVDRAVFASDGQLQVKQHSNIYKNIWLGGFFDYDNVKNLDNVTVVSCLGKTGYKTLGFDYS